MGLDLTPPAPQPARRADAVEAIDVHAESRPQQRLVCPFCHDLLGATGNLSCPGATCGAAYHKGCWKECVDSYGGCAVYGCQGGRGPNDRLGRAAPSPEARARERSRRPVVAAAVVGILVALAGVGAASYAGSKVAEKDTSGLGWRAPPPVAPTAHDAEGWLTLARSRFNGGDHPGTIEATTRVLALSSPTSRTYALAAALRGLAHAHEGRLSSAFDDLDLACKLLPEEPYVFHCRAIADEERGDHAACVQDCERVLQLEPHYSEAALLRSKIAEHRAALTSASH